MVIIIDKELRMDKFDFNLTQLWLIMVVAISGALGGCAAAFHKIPETRTKVLLVSIAGYLTAGMFGSLMMFSLLSFSGMHLFDTLEGTILWSGITGFVVSAALAGTNLAFKIILEKLGIEIEVNIKKI